jgi:hypothetical protein
MNPLQGESGDIGVATDSQTAVLGEKELDERLCRLMDHLKPPQGEMLADSFFHEIPYLGLLPGHPATKCIL